MQKDELRPAILVILKNFSFTEEKRWFGSRSWRVFKGIRDLDVFEFTPYQLLKSINEHEAWKKEPLSHDEVLSVLKKLKEANLVTKNEKNEVYEITKSSRDALSEFFTLEWRPRRGKTGFLRYIRQSKKRRIMWYCLYKNQKLNEQEAKPYATLGKASAEDDNEKYLAKLESEKYLRSETLNGQKLYKVIDEEKLFDNLYSGYPNFCFAKPTIREYILTILSYHEKLSGKELHDSLSDVEIKCDPSAVYKDLHKLEKEGTIIRVGEPKKAKKGGGYSELWALNIPDLDEYRKQMIDGIQLLVEKSKFGVGEEFYKEISERKPNEMNMFVADLDSIVLKDEHFTESLTLWVPFIKTISPDTINDIRAKLSQPRNDVELVRTLEELSRSYKLSPGIVSFLYLFMMRTKEVSK
jgi:Fe2+ or Zn2+ uptake regulation protein